MPALSNSAKEAVQRIRELWKVFELLESMAGGLQASMSNSFKDAIQQTREFCKLSELLESVTGGLQASFKQFFAGSHTENTTVLEGARIAGIRQYE